MVDHRCFGGVERGAQAGGKQSESYGVPERLDGNILGRSLLVVTVNCWGVSGMGLAGVPRGESPLSSFCLLFRWGDAKAESPFSRAFFSLVGSK